MEDRLDVGGKCHLRGAGADTVARWFMVLLLALPLMGCRIYSADPISGRVVDKATGEPIEGAVVVAAWIPTGGFEGNNPQGLVQVSEGITNASGEYTIPAWGPKLYFGGGTLGINSPQLLVFKYGFEVEVGGEWTHWKSEAPSHMRSERNGKVVELLRSNSLPTDYAVRLMSIDIRILDRIAKAGGCTWQQVPFLLRAVDVAREDLKASGVSYVPIRSLDHLQLDVNCGDVKAFVAEKTR